MTFPIADAGREARAHWELRRAVTEATNPHWVRWFDYVCRPILYALPTLDRLVILNAVMTANALVPDSPANNELGNHLLDQIGWFADHFCPDCAPAI